MKLVYFAPLEEGSVSLMRARALMHMDIDVILVPNTLDVGILNGWSFALWLESIGVHNRKIFEINNALLEAVPSDLGKGILILDKAQCIKPETLLLIRKKCPNYTVVNFNPDNPYVFRSMGWSLYHQCLPYIDIFFVPRESTKLYIESRYQKTAVRFNWAVDRKVHVLQDQEVSLHGFGKQNLVFIGSCEYRRLFFLLIGSFILPGRIYIWGEKWGVFKYWPLFTCAGHGLYGEEYKKQTMDSAMVFCFFNRANKDDQNTRFFSLLGLSKAMIVEETNVVNKVLGSKYPLKFQGLFDFLFILRKIKNNDIREDLVKDSYRNSRRYVKTINEQMDWLVHKVGELVKK